SSKALGRAGMIPGLPRLLLLVIFLVKLQSGGLGSQNTTMPGALCPASSSLLCFIGWSYPQIVLYSHFYYGLETVSHRGQLFDFFRSLFRRANRFGNDEISRWASWALMAVP